MAAPNEQDRAPKMPSGQEQRDDLDSKLNELSEGKTAAESDRWEPLGKSDEPGERSDVRGEPGDSGRAERSDR